MSDPITMQVHLNSDQLVELINSFNVKLDSIEASIGIKDDQIQKLQERVFEIEQFLHI